MLAGPEHRASLRRLFDAVWERLTPRIDLAASLGASWFDRSTAFVALADGEVVAHVGLLPIELILEGDPVTVAGIHAVGTHPDHRGRGHCRALLEEALAFADTRYPLAQLTTEVPRVFRRHGFRSVPQWTWTVPLPPHRRGGFSPIDHHLPDELDRLWHTLSERTPISHRLGVVEPGAHFIIDEVLYARGLSRVQFCPRLETYVVLESRDERLRLIDVVARRLPRLEDLLVELSLSPHTSIELAFTPDRFGVEVAPRAGAYDDLHVMVRGDYPPEDEGPFTLPELAHC